MPVPFFAVHISDGVLRPEAAYVGIAAAGLLVAFVARSLTDDIIPRLSLLTAAVFVASQLHVPVAGASVHLLLNALAGILLGARAAVAVGVAVGLQAWLFAHGGLTSWGVNTLTMALPALAGGALFRTVYRRWPRRVFVWGLLAGLFTSTATIVLACLAIYFLGIENAWIAGVVLAAHLPVLGLEGLLTATVARYIAKVKPEWFE